MNKEKVNKKFEEWFVSYPSGEGMPPEIDRHIKKVARVAHLAGSNHMLEMVNKELGYE